MERRDAVVIGASAGGIDALRLLVERLPASLPLALCVVLHSNRTSPQVLDAILTRAGHLPAAYARHGEAMEPGRIYIAPADYHLEIERGRRLRLTRGPRENRFRPSVDVLFRSAALSLGPQVVGIVLSGALDDGTAGLWAIKARGGLAVVQDPDEALTSGMPESALQHVAVDYCLPVAAIADVLVDVARSPPAPVALANGRVEGGAGCEAIGPASYFACPECHGVLAEVIGGGPVRYRCRTGHAYSAESLLDEMIERNEEVLWSAVRALDETADVLAGLGERAAAHGHAEDAQALRQRAEATRRRSERVRDVTQAPGTSLPPRTAG